MRENRFTELLEGYLQLRERLQVRHGTVWEEMQHISQELEEMICPMADEHDEFFQRSTKPEEEPMSIEKLLSENTEALRALTIALAANHVPLKAGAVTPPAAAPKAAPATSAALDYEKDVKPLALRVAKEKTRDGLIAVLSEFKVAQANLLKPEQWGAFIAACNKALT